MLAKCTNEPDSAYPLESFVTSGDKIQDRRLEEAGGKGLFTKELDEALLDHRIDAAVHSMKDLPTRMPPGLVIASVPSREDPRDAFVSVKAKEITELPHGAIIGTASLRRQAQTLNIRPDLCVVTLRGTVQTRVRRLAEGEIDATFLALAGLKRLGLADRATSLVPIDLMPSAPCQGALAVTCRENDRATIDILSHLTIREFEIATTAERAFLDALDGSCRTPIGAFARVDGTVLNFVGEVLTPDGRLRWRRSEEIRLGPNPLASAEALGRRLGVEIRAEAGTEFRPEAAGGW
jgi:hydroxymethylbilane synthase